MSDFELLLADLGISEEERSALSATGNLEGEAAFPPMEFNVSWSNSSIGGKGIFAQENIPSGELIGPARLGGLKTVLGFGMNHSNEPNAFPLAHAGDGYVVAARDILAGEEILVDYRQTMGCQLTLEGLAVSNAYKRLVTLLDSPSTLEERRAGIPAVEAVLKALPQAEHGLDHIFCEGLYIRHARIAPGTLFVTPSYLEENVLSLLCGTINVITEWGFETLTAPAFLITKPGTKRLIFAVDYVEAHTVHPNPTNTRDVSELEARIYGGDN